jgi:transcriptional regulator with XRE-family HTH domain
VIAELHFAHKPCLLIFGELRVVMPLGEFLRSARESAGLSIDELADLTSIRPGLIREIEKNNFIHCGGDIYARGHLRNIAAKISVDAQTLIDLYNEEHSTEARTIHDMLVENNVTKLPKERKVLSWKPLAIASIVILAAIAGGQIIISNSKTVVTPTVTESPTPPPVATPTAEPTPTVEATVVPDASGEMNLTIAATRGNSNIDVVVDGKHLFKGPIFQGGSKSFSAPTSISIYLGNAGDLDLTLNGKALAPLGERNQEVRKTFRSK